MQLVTLNGKELKDIAHKNRTAEVTMTSLAMRERVRTFSDIVRTRTQLLKMGEKIVEDDYLQFWKDLEKAGIGSIINGQKGRPARFEWHFSMKDVAIASLEGMPRPVKLVEEAKAKPAPKQNVSRIVYVTLRKDFDVTIAVPSDLNVSEVDTISKALRKASA